MKTRFAPSPTGVMHLGNLRTALVNALIAHGTGGQLLLRIEDTDKERSKPEFVEQILLDLKWLGIEVDEGPVFQSDRTAIYDRYFEQLIESDRAYLCYCSEQELAIHRKAQLSAGIAPRYSGTCRHLTEGQITDKRSKGLRPSLRFRVPDGQTIRFEDAIFGPKQFLSDDVGDFIIQKQDGGPTFMFCNAVDDALMEVTHAFRGEDHVTNTPRQLMILEALGLKAPQYGHFPIILGMDGKPLSKRNGSQSVLDLKQSGFLPEAILNYIARLGHSYEKNDFFSLEALGKEYSLNKVGTAPAKFDTQQLKHWQDTAWQTLTPTRIADVLSSVKPLIPAARWMRFVEIIRQNISFENDAILWAERIFADECLLDEDGQAVLKTAGPDYFAAMLEALEKGEPAKAALEHTKQTLGIKGKALFMPLRIALTGQSKGPTFDELFELMPPKILKKRIESARQEAS